MSKKRAFVRYSKQGKIVPGSLILTAGSFPNGSSTWKEVPADLCCNSGECVSPDVILQCVVEGLSTNPECTLVVTFECSVGNIYWEIILPLPAPYNLLETITFLSLQYSWIGDWSFDENTVTLVMNGNIAKGFCPEGSITLTIGTSCPALPNPNQ